jgi:hypothetical protein
MIGNMADIIETMKITTILITIDIGLKRGDS